MPAVPTAARTPSDPQSAPIRPAVKTVPPVTAPISLENSPHVGRIALVSAVSFVIFLFFLNHALQRPTGVVPDAPSPGCAAALAYGKSMIALDKQFTAAIAASTANPDPRARVGQLTTSFEDLQKQKSDLGAAPIDLGMGSQNWDDGLTEMIDSLHQVSGPGGVVNTAAIHLGAQEMSQGMMSMGQGLKTACGTH